MNLLFYLFNANYDFPKTEIKPKFPKNTRQKQFQTKKKKKFNKRKNDEKLKNIFFFYFWKMKKLNREMI